MKKINKTSDQKLDRKTVERNRRIHMKGLCFKLTSLIPSHHFKPSKELLSQQDQLDQAASYIKKLREKIEELKVKKEVAMSVSGASTTNDIKDSRMNIGLKLPVLEFRDLGSTLEVVLISGLKKNFMLYEAVSVLEEEGADVVSANFSTVGDKVFHTIHAQVRVSRVGVDSSRVYQRLQELIY